MSDPFVKAVQKKLIAKGYTLRGGADGVAGAGTYAAISEFQDDRGLPITGKADKATWDALDDFGERQVDRDADHLPVRATASPWPRQGDCEQFYGEVGKNQVMLNLPFTMRIAWDLGKSVSRISVHEKVHDSARRAFSRIANAYDEAERADLGIDLFGGSLNVRKMRGGTNWSMHSWGIAIDFDPIRNQLKWDRSRARLARSDAEEFWRIWEAEGWLSLGRARDYDWMHIQAARL